MLVAAYQQAFAFKAPGDPLAGSGWLTAVPTRVPVCSFSINSSSRRTVRE